MDSIGNFAENLILNQVNDIKTGKQLPPTVSEEKKTAPAGIDISETKVPDSFMKELLGEQFVPQQKTQVNESFPQLVWSEEEQEKEAEVIQLTEETGQQLIPLLEEVRDLLKEMTTVGGLGVNLGGEASCDSFEREEKKLGYQKSQIPNREKLKKALRARLRR